VNKTQEKIFVIIVAALVIVALFYFPLSNSYLGFLIQPLLEPNWDEIHPKYIVKNSVMISLVEEEGGKCKMLATELDNILLHEYFARADDFANKVNFDQESETIKLPCEVLPDEESRLHVWYVTQDSPDFPTIFKYYVSPISETISAVDTDEKTILPEHDHHKISVKSVETENPYVNQILDQCGADGMCGIQILQELAKTEKRETIFDTVYEILIAYQKSGLDCHGLGHHYGEFLYDQTENLTEAIALVLDRQCSNALAMGITENYFKSEILFENLKPENLEFVTICDQFGTNPYDLGRLECVHGVGHGLLSAYEYDVFPAVERCDEYQTDVEKRLCYEGLFMENTNLDSLPVADLDANDIHYPCNELNEKYVGACYYYQISHILREKGNVDDALKECDKLDDEVFVKFCYLGMGRQVAISFPVNTENIIPVCELGLPEYQNFCLQGTLIVLAEEFGLDKGFEICKTFPDYFKQDCYTWMGSSIGLKYSDKDEMEEQCSKAESIEHSEICKKGIDSILEKFS